jgi:hypothetical protein
VPARSGAHPFFLVVGLAPPPTVRAFLSLDTSGSAIFFTTSIGTCSKCVWDFRVASVELAMLTGTGTRVMRVRSFGNRVASIAVTGVRELRVLCAA